MQTAHIILVVRPTLESLLPLLHFAGPAKYWYITIAEHLVSRSSLSITTHLHLIDTVNTSIPSSNHLQSANMRPILLQGHERSLNQIKYNRVGDLLFSVAKDKIVCAWYTSNGERLGTYAGHQGAVWTVDVSPKTELLATGAADNTIKLWNIQTGECVKTWEHPTAVKRVQFSEDGTKLLGVTEKRMGYLGTIVVYGINYEDFTQQSDEQELKITCEESKATVAGWSYLDRYIVAGHEDGSVTQYDAKASLL